MLVCHLWPAVSPHGPDVPTSVWNLSLRVWRSIAASADEYVASLKQKK